MDHMTNPYPQDAMSMPTCFHYTSFCTFKSALDIWTLSGVFAAGSLLQSGVTVAGVVVLAILAAEKSASDRGICRSHCNTRGQGEAHPAKSARPQDLVSPIGTQTDGQI